MDNNQNKGKKPRKPRQNSKYIIRKFFIDDSGQNYLILKSNDKLITIRLKVSGDTKIRLIGTVTKSTKTLTIKRKRGIHLFLKGNAYGFNDYVLRESKTFDKIMLSDEFCNWKIPVSYILENGKYLNFQTQGFELQRFVNLNDLEQFLVKPKENRRL